MKKKIFILSLLMILASCTKPTLSLSEDTESLSQSDVTSEVITSDEGETSNDISEDSSNDVTSSVEESSATSEDVTSVDPGTSENPGTSEDPVTSEEGEVYANLSEISELAKTFKSLRNDKGVYKSSHYAEFRAQLLTLQDYITTQNGYNNQYKAFVANATGHITINLNLEQYNAIKNYKDKQQVYDFKGYIGLYNDEPEVDMDGLGKPVYQAGVILSYNYKSFALPGGTINDLLTRVKATPFNTKGINWSENIYKYHLKYLAKVENAVALFSDGTNVIQLHSHDKINNSFTVGNSYYIYAREGLFNFKPELEYVGLESASDVITDYSLMKNDLKASTLYTYKYELDKSSALNSNMSYADQLVKLFYFEGYANYYTEDGMDYVVLEDTEKASSYRSYTAALSAKAMFVNNDHSVKLWKVSHWLNSPFLDYVDSEENTPKTKIGLYFVGYVYNTMKYWLVQVIDGTIVELS